MYSSNNIYGIQKTPDVSVRTNLDMAMGTGQFAAQGAQIGSKFGPYGAGIGAIAGGVIGLWGQNQARNQEKKYQYMTDQDNKFVDNLSGRMPQNTIDVPTQARNGMNANGAEIVEIEGNENTGLGEIHTDKNYNIKTIANGAPSHENGGLKVAIKPNDIIFDSQKDPKKYQMVMSNIKKYKLTGDSNAKEWLDKEAASKPTDADYGYDNKRPDGMGTVLEQPTDNFQVFDPTKIGTNKYTTNIDPVSITAKSNANQPMTMKGIQPFDNSLTSGLMNTAPKNPDMPIISGTPNTTIPPQGNGYVPTIVKADQNPLENANIINNLVQGTKPAERVNRRYITPESQQYRDRSYTMRNAIGEMRNANTKAVQSHGMSVGQEQSNLSQIAVQSLERLDQVNEKEAQRNDQVDYMNVSARNQAGQTNTQLANQYDMQDAQNRGMKQNYVNQAALDVTNKAIRDTSTNYQIKRDNAEYQMEGTRLKYTGTGNFKTNLNSATGYDMVGDKTSLPYNNPYGNQNKPITLTSDKLPQGFKDGDQTYTFDGKTYIAKKNSDGTTTFILQ